MGLAQIKIKTPFKNKYFSVSRIKLYEKCPLAFKFGYIDHLERKFGEAAAFGSLCHTAKEYIFRWVEDEEFVGTVPSDTVISEFRRAFENSEVVGTANYNAALKITRSYFRKHDHVDASTILGIEREFTITIESDDGSVVFEVYGIIDRIDRVNADTIRVVDYKSNKQLFTREEMDNDLQMSIYGLAVKTLWPWVKNIEFAFDMLRHNVRQFTRRSDDDLDRAADYVIAIGSRIESALEFPPTLNNLCAWCDFRAECDEYNNALKKGEQDLSYLVAADDIEKVCAERNRASALETIAKRRKREMDDIIMAHLNNNPKLDKLVVGDWGYKPSQSFDTVMPTDKTVNALKDALGVDDKFVRDRITTVQKGLVDKLINEAKLASGKRTLLRAKLDTITKKYPKSAWVNARKINQRKA